MGIGFEPGGRASEHSTVANVMSAELAQQGPFPGPGRRLAIVGAGFVGVEVASTARSLGCEVSVVDVAGVPLERVLGREVGEVLAARYRAYGVDLRLGTGLAGFVAGADGRVSSPSRPWPRPSRSEPEAGRAAKVPSSRSAPRSDRRSPASSTSPRP